LSRRRLNASASDVADERVVHAVAAQFAQARLEPGRDLHGDPELLVLLLADVTRAIVHRDADAPLVGRVGTAPVPEAAVPDEHAAACHLGRDAVVVLAVVR